MEDQPEHILDLLEHHKLNIEEKIQVRGQKFSSRQLKKQYQVNLEFKELAGQIVAAVEKREAERVLVAGPACRKSWSCTSKTSS